MKYIFIKVPDDFEKEDCSHCPLAYKINDSNSCKFRNKQNECSIEFAASEYDKGFDDGLEEGLKQ